MNEFLQTAPFDLYELHLFCLVLKHHSFTKAAENAGLTQSAITRQVQGMENLLGLKLLERTTRSVRPTPAGEFLYQEAMRLTGDVSQTLQRLREEFAGARPRVRLGVARSVGLAYLPGFFHATLKRTPQISCVVAHQPSQEIFTALETNELDIGILCPPKRLPKTFRVTHKFDDAFTLIVPKSVTDAPLAPAWSDVKRNAWMAKQPWLLLTENSQTGQQLRSWMKRQSWSFEPTMQLDNFDLIINLVALGLGISFVPIRSLALYRQKNTFQQVTLPVRFTREIAVVVRRNRKMPPHVGEFIENILF